MAQIKIMRGTVSGSDINEYHLVTNHLLDPGAGIADFIMYAEKRPLTTLLVSGARDGLATRSGYTPENNEAIRSFVKEIPNGGMTSGNSYRYKIQGRIMKAVEVVGSGAVGVVTRGTSSTGGFFSIYLGDNTLAEGMVCTFPNGKQARIYEMPKNNGTNKWLYKFQTWPGDVFDWTSWFTGVSRRTIFGGYTSYGERSQKGYSSFTYPDEFIQHTTIQRKGFNISGSANVNEVIWYEVNGMKGFVYEAEAQTRAKFLQEDEFQKWNGRSTMKDEFGNLLDKPTMYDKDGEPVIAGDGWFELVKGANDMEMAGAEPTYQDFEAMVMQIKERKEMEGGDPIIVITGNGGMAAARRICKQEAQDSGMRIMVDPSKANSVGGDVMAAGYRFERLNIAGEQLIFVEHPIFNDPERYPLRMSNGYLRQSMTYYFTDWGSSYNGMKNIDILARGRNGVNRDFVFTWINGLTGSGNKPQNTVDADDFQMLKENMLVVRITKTQGILSPSLTA